MKRIDALATALAAVAARPERPATATLHDSPDARLIVFRLDAGQVVTPHTSTSSVLLVGLAGAGFASGAEGEAPIAAGEVVSYEPNELHGMRAGAERLVLLAVITPRPGSR